MLQDSGILDPCSMFNYIHLYTVYPLAICSNCLQLSPRPHLWVSQQMMCLYSTSKFIQYVECKSTCKPAVPIFLKQCNSLRFWLRWAHWRSPHKLSFGKWTKVKMCGRNIAWIRMICTDTELTQKSSDTKWLWQGFLSLGTRIATSHRGQL
jgi:hypothetical protein